MDPLEHRIFALLPLGDFSPSLSLALFYYRRNDLKSIYTLILKLIEIYTILYNSSCTNSISPDPSAYSDHHDNCTERYSIINSLLLTYFPSHLSESLSTLYLVRLNPHSIHLSPTVHVSSLTSIPHELLNIPLSQYLFSFT